MLQILYKEKHQKIRTITSQMQTNEQTLLIQKNSPRYLAERHQHQRRILPQEKQVSPQWTPKKDQLGTRRVHHQKQNQERQLGLQQGLGYLHWELGRS